MVRRRGGALTGALVAVALTLGGGALLADDVVAVIGATTEPVAWTAVAPAARQPAPVRAASKAATKAAAKQAPAAARAVRAGYGPTGPRGPGRCSCAGGAGNDGSPGNGSVRVRGPQIVKGSDPPSVRLVVPGLDPVDRGIADTGTHSDGTQITRPRPLRYHPNSRITLTATPAPGRVDLSWFHNGDPSVLRYRVGFQPNTWVRSTTRSDTWTTPPISWQDVRPAAAQGPMTWRLPGAVRGVEYTFWLEVDAATPEDTLGSNRILIAQTSRVRVP